MDDDVDDTGRDNDADDNDDDDAGNDTSSTTSDEGDKRNRDNGKDACTLTTMTPAHQ